YTRIKCFPHIELLLSQKYQCLKLSRQKFSVFIGSTNAILFKRRIEKPHAAMPCTDTSVATKNRSLQNPLMNDFQRICEGS
ncbi:MAG: hypothetical protein Q3990_09845, partial [Desulfovibrionaceae bacterium]|nr:hypothetical protein [Desulfovibrionaceae bacterium]